VSKSDIRSYDVHESLENVAGKLKAELQLKNEPLTALLTGVDDGWEVCLLKFMVDFYDLGLRARQHGRFSRAGSSSCSSPSSDFTPKDRTHFSAKGARVMAFFVAQGAATADDRLKAAEITPLPDPTTALKAVPVGSSTPANPGSSNTPDATMKNEVPPAR
jgi:hypothetical protein